MKCVANSPLRQSTKLCAVEPKIEPTAGQVYLLCLQCCSNMVGSMQRSFGSSTSMFNGLLSLSQNKNGAYGDVTQKACKASDVLKNVWYSWAPLVVEK